MSPSDPSDPSVRFLITCLMAPECKVAFEPEGAVITITSDERLIVEIRGPGSGEAEISYMPGGVSVAAWSGADTSAWNKAGERLDI